MFTLFFFVSIGLPVPRFSGPDGSAAEPCFLFLLGSQYPVSLGPMVRLLSLLFVSIELLFGAIILCIVIHWSPLESIVADF